MTDMTMTTSLAEVVLAEDTAVASVEALAVAATEEVSPEVLMAEVSAEAAPEAEAAVSADRKQKTIKEKSRNIPALFFMHLCDPVPITKIHFYHWCQVRKITLFDRFS